jgi:hypothetical protein
MTEVTEQAVPETISDTDLVAAVRHVLEASSEPMTLSKIRSALPLRFRTVDLETLADNLRRQVAANALHQYPKYRSQQDRFWDRPMRVHLTALLRETLQEQPLAWSELRRKLPSYAQAQAESVLQEQVAQGLLYCHPPLSSRGGPRYGLQRPDPRDSLRPELTALFTRLEARGFSRAQLRQGALELLHEEEWESPPATAAAPRPGAGAPGSRGTSEQAAPAEAAPAAQRTEPPSAPDKPEPSLTDLPAGEVPAPTAAPSPGERPDATDTAHVPA